MTFYGVVFRLIGWAIGLGLVTGELTYYNDGHTDGLMVAAGVAILLYWTYLVPWRIVNAAVEARRYRM